MDYDPFAQKRWETIVQLPFDEQVEKICHADLPDFIKGVSEMVHDHPVSMMGGPYGRTLGLPRIDNVAGTQNSLHEQLHSNFRSGWLELSYSRSMQGPDYREVGFDEVVVKHNIWSNKFTPEWLQRTGRGDFEEFEPTEEEAAAFRSKCLEALVEGDARKRRIGGGGIRAVMAEIKGDFL